MAYTLTHAAAAHHFATMRRATANDMSNIEEFTGEYLAAGREYLAGRCASVEPPIEPAGAWSREVAWVHKLSPQAFRLLKQLARRGNAEAGPGLHRGRREILRGASPAPRGFRPAPRGEKRALPRVYRGGATKAPPPFPPCLSLDSLAA